MYQSVVQRFPRTKNSDLSITFLPVVLAFGVRGLFQKANLSATAFLTVQLLLAFFLIVSFLLSYRFYFRSFRYTIVDRDYACKDTGHIFPKNSLTFERFYSKKSRIYERVKVEELLYLADPDESFDIHSYGTLKKTFVLTVLSVKTAHMLYYKQENAIYCAVFHPNTQQVLRLRQWMDSKQLQTQSFKNTILF